MTTIRVTFANGRTRDVKMAASLSSPAAIRAYFFGTDGSQPTNVVRIDALDPISGAPCVNGRIA